MGGEIIKQLTYFVDADSDKEVGRIEILNSRFSWKEAKEKIAQEVEKFSQEYLGGLV